MKISLGQLLVEGTEPIRNINRAIKLIEKASNLACDLIILPETIDFGWTHPDALKESKSIPGSYSDFFIKAAVEHKIWICVGLTERKNDQNYNTALLINDLGEIVLKHRKINLLEVEFPYYNPGSKLEVVDTKFGKIGLNICADNYIDSLNIGHTLAHMGAQLIISPAAWTVNHDITENMDPYNDKWIKPLEILASNHNIVVASCTSVGYIVGGPYEGKKMIGGSLIVEPKKELKEGIYNEFASELITADIELNPIKNKGVLFGKNLTNNNIKFY